MTDITELELGSILSSFDFSKFKTIADIGGGHGILLENILKVSPNSKGILFDFAAVKGVDLQHQSRMEIQEGSFFEKMPNHADLYVMKHIAHGLSDDEMMGLLEKVRLAGNPECRVLLSNT